MKGKMSFVKNIQNIKKTIKTVGEKIYPFDPENTLSFRPLHYSDDPSVVTLDIPGYKQLNTYACGYCCALMAVCYHFRGRSKKRLYKLVGTYKEGTSESSLVRGLRASNLRVGKLGKLTFDKLWKNIGSNKLMIVAVKGKRWPHYVLIYGYGIYPNRIFIADPVIFRRCEYKWVDFRRRMIPGDNVLVISKRRA